MSLYSLHLSYPGSNFGNFVYISKHQLPFPVLWPEGLLLLFSRSVMSDSSQPMDYSTPGFPAMHRLLGFARRIAQVLRLDYSADNPPQGSLDVLVPQTVDEGVQHRGDRPLHPSLGKMRQLNWDILQGLFHKTNNQQVRTTGGEGFVPPTGRWDSQNGGNNSIVRENNSWYREKTRDGPSKNMTMLLPEVSEQARSWSLGTPQKKWGISASLQKVSCDTIKQCIWESKRLINNDTRTNKPQIRGFMITG